MRAYKILPVEMRVKDFNLSRSALRRLEWMDWYFSHGKNAEATCRHFSISKSVFYRWLPRFSKYNLLTLEGKSKRPKHLRSMTTSPYILQRIYQIRLNDLTMSKYKIQEQLRREGINISTKVIQKVINRHPELINVEQRKKIQRSMRLRISRVRAAQELKEKSLGSLVQIDTKHFYVLGHRFYIFAAVDCKSRYAYCFAYTTISSKSANDFLKRVIDYFPFKISAINTDNGSEYLLYFHKLTQSLSIPHYFSYPHTPKMNARVERFIQTLEYEFLHYRDSLPEIENIQELCEEFNQKYNQIRFHQALSYKTPQEYVTTLLSQKGGQPFSI